MQTIRKDRAQSHKSKVLKAIGLPDCRFFYFLKSFKNSKRGKEDNG